MNIIRHTTQEEAQQAAAQQLQNLLTQHADQSIVLMLSGGSAFTLLQNLDVTTVAHSLTITMLDERFSSDPEINNFAQLTKTAFYVHAREHGARFINTCPAQDESAEMLAERLNDSLSAVLQSSENLIVIATMGMGSDGHVSGMMPYTEDAAYFTQTFMETKNCFVAYDAGTKNQFPLRVTTSRAFMRNRIDHAVLYVSGDEKKVAFDALCSEQGTVNTTPARIVKEMKDVSVFTDIQKE